MCSQKTCASQFSYSAMCDLGMKFRSTERGTVLAQLDLSYFRKKKKTGYVKTFGL